MAAQHRIALRHVLALLAAGLGGCFRITGPEPSVIARSAPSPSAEERYCAWYGDAREGILYFGQAAFWSAYRIHDEDPTADLRAEGPQLIGRFDLRRSLMLEPLDVTAPGARSGVWDVLAHPNGRVYYTTYFELSGFVDPASGEVRRFTEAGVGLNELAAGPDGGILASRYGGPEAGGGSVVLLDGDGTPVAEWPLTPPTGFRVAPKTVAFDPGRGEIWVTTDLLPTGPGPTRHDARVLDLEGRERARIDAWEIQSVGFGPDGTGYLAEVDGSTLYIRVIPPEATGSPGERGVQVLVDPRFDRDRDFVQDIQIGADGPAAVSRWSGRVHLVWPDPLVHTVRLLRLRPEGLFYTAVHREGGVCATLCADVTVVCQRTLGF